MKTIVLLLIFSFVRTSDAEAQSLRIATYNLNWGNRRGDLVIDAIDTADADIVCFQETTPQSEQFLKRHLAARYPHFHASGYNGKYAAERFAFASNIKLDAVTFHRPEHGLFGFYAATFEYAGDNVPHRERAFGAFLHGERRRHRGCNGRPLQDGRSTFERDCRHFECD